MPLKFVVPEQIILKKRQIYSNLKVSYYSELISVFDGWGLSENNRHIAVSDYASYVSKPQLVNRRLKRFDKQ